MECPQRTANGTHVAVLFVGELNSKAGGVMKILVGTDGSEFSSRALEAACDIAQGRADTTFCVVAAYEAPNPIAAEPYALSPEYYEHLDEFARDEAKNNAKKGVEFIRTKLRDASVRIDEIVELGKPAQIIVETAGDIGADLVVVGSHGRSFWGRLALGSVSDAVSHHAPCSVLIVKDRGRTKER